MFWMNEWWLSRYKLWPSALSQHVFHGLLWQNKPTRTGSLALSFKICAYAQSIDCAASFQLSEISRAWRPPSLCISPRERLCASLYLRGSSFICLSWSALLSLWVISWKHKKAGFSLFRHAALHWICWWAQVSLSQSGAGNFIIWVVHVSSAGPVRQRACLHLILFSLS